MNKNQLVNWLKLTRVPKLGPSKITKLLSILSMEDIFEATDEQLLQTRCFTELMLPDFHKLKNASDENFIKAIDECEKNNIEIVSITDEKYPKNLRLIPYPPLTLFLKGNLDLLNHKKIAIVGSRQVDENAKNWAYEKARELCKEGYIIVSGGAKGIDYSAHIGAIENGGKTICVLGSGFFKMYPEEHKDLFNKIANEGLLISEHLPNFPGNALALVQRNRITSGISEGLIMVASGERGGSMVQTKMAFEQRKPIFCPKESLNLQPNEGIKQILTEWKGIEIDKTSEIIEYYNKRKDNIQMKLA
jgi:DNA processing protein